ncbi:MAG: membrane protein insertase YidC [Thermodesulfovibrionales bacterium]
MEKRALIAVGLAFIILFLYQQFFYKPQPQKIQKKAEVTKKEEPLPVKTAELTIPKKTAEGKNIKVETDLYSAIFSTKGGTLKYYEIKNYKDKEGKNIILLKTVGPVPPLAIGIQDNFNLADADFFTSGKDIKLNKVTPSETLIFEYLDKNFSIRRTYTFYNDNYKIDIKDEVSGLTDYWITIGTDFGIYDNKQSAIHTGPVLLKETDRIEFNAKKLKEAKTFSGGLKWIAQEDKYFFASLVPLTNMEEAKVWAKDGSPLIAFRGKPDANRFILYAGPKEYERLKTLKVGLEHIIDFGFFSIIAVPLFWILKLFYKFLGNYGWAIVFITLIVRIPFIPLINKSQKAMKKMQELQPKMAEIRERFKKDPQRMQQEIMVLYKKYKVNPLSGCLPIILQIPIFFALYKILLIAIELRGAPFMFWIKDLSSPDTLFGHIPAWFPLIGGFAVGPLPILMGITMVIQQKMTPTSMDPAQNKIMMLMPIVFTFIFLNFASGLVLYWLMNNIFSIIQQFYVNKKLKVQT